MNKIATILVAAIGYQWAGARHNAAAMLMLLLLGVAGSSQAQTDAKIGVFYYPGWKDNTLGLKYQTPWNEIKAFPEREPLLGWYKEGELPVMEQQLAWMKKYGIDYVAFDWQWSGDGKSPADQALNAYLRTKKHSDVEFALIWTNHTKYIFSLAQFKQMFHFWAQRYMFRPEYLKFNAKPVAFIFSAETLNNNAEKIGMKPAELLALGDEIFKEEGLPGLSFIGGVGAANGRNFDYSRSSGYIGFTSYFYHGPATFRLAGGNRTSYSYRELDDGYRDHWKWMLKNAEGIFVLPMASGWDKRPWGGSSDPLHDNSIGTGDEFETHLRAAKAVIDSNPRKIPLAVICCWNEFGEGSFIEPTKKDGFKLVEKVRKVFKAEK